MQKVSEEPSTQLKSAKKEQDELHCEILEVQQMLQKEKDLKNQTDAENRTCFIVKEAVCKEIEQQLQREKRLRAEAKSSRLEAVKNSKALFQRLEQA